MRVLYLHFFHGTCVSGQDDLGGYPSCGCNTVEVQVVNHPEMGDRHVVSASQGAPAGLALPARGRRV
jgi:hypothetical protein